MEAVIFSETRILAIHGFMTIELIFNFTPAKTLNFYNAISAPRQLQ
jgi:hypothetical protein